MHELTTTVYHIACSREAQDYIKVHIMEGESLQEAKFQPRVPRKF